MLSWLFLRGPVPSFRDHGSASEARRPGHRASEAEPWSRKEGTGPRRKSQESIGPGLGSRLLEALGRRLDLAPA